jgi:hypothetical protein
MKPFNTYSNWGYIDQLDGIDLVDGERLRVQFPNGTIIIAPIRVQKDRFTYNDMGHKNSGPDYKGYLNWTVQGLPVKIYVRDTPLKAKRIEQ